MCSLGIYLLFYSAIFKIPTIYLYFIEASTLQKYLYNTLDFKAVLEWLDIFEPGKVDQMGFLGA